MTAAEASSAVMSFIVRSGTVASVLYVRVGSGNVMPGVSGLDIALTALTWRNGPWFLVEVD